MKARNLLESSIFEPETLHLAFQAFDRAGLKSPTTSMMTRSKRGSGWRMPSSPFRMGWSMMWSG